MKSIKSEMISDLSSICYAAVTLEVAISRSITKNVSSLVQFLAQSLSLKATKTLSKKDVNAFSIFIISWQEVLDSISHSE